MGVGHAYAIALQGAHGRVVTVECDVSRGLPGISVVGMGDTAVVQAKDRIRSALRNTGIVWPGSRTVMSLSPASMPKSGSGYDVAMVCAMLLASGDDSIVAERVGGCVFVGELGLDGAVRPVPGAFPRVIAAADHGFESVIVPEACAREAAEAVALLGEDGSGIRVLVAGHLRNVLDWMRGGELDTAKECVSVVDSAAGRLGGGRGDLAGVGLGPGSGTEPGLGSGPGPGSGAVDHVDMSDVLGQPEAVRAVEVAAAGGHNLMLIGPPGSGKSMLAERLPGVLPPMTRREQREAAMIHSIAGTKGDLASIWEGRRPFVTPHHSITHSAMVGGGATPVPGAVSLAHHGVLFIDEVAEARRDVLDALRTPMEKRRVEIIRQRQIMVFPAQFQLVLAANPCPCGAELPSECRCPSGVRARYQAKVSGPLRDRIDVFATTRSLADVSRATQRAENTATIANRVLAAREASLARWAELDQPAACPATSPEGAPACRSNSESGSISGPAHGISAHPHRRSGAPRAEYVNATVPSTVLREHFSPDREGTAALEGMLISRELTQRGADRALRVAWTLADLSGSSRPGLDHVLDAVDLFKDDSQ